MGGVDESWGASKGAKGGELAFGEGTGDLEISEASELGMWGFCVVCEVEGEGLGRSEDDGGLDVAAKGGGVVDCRATA